VPQLPKAEVLRMSGFPCFEPGEYAQLIIVHMDGSESETQFTDEHGWQHHTAEGIVVYRRGGRTTFPWINIKSFTVVYPDEPTDPDETLAPIRHLDPDNDGKNNPNGGPA
jgi:hypothetical protein